MILKVTARTKYYFYSLTGKILCDYISDILMEDIWKMPFTYNHTNVPVSSISYQFLFQV